MWSTWEIKQCHHEKEYPRIIKTAKFQKRRPNTQNNRHLKNYKQVRDEMYGVGLRKG